MSGFIEFRKIPRLNRDICVTEKIDGTNAQIYIATGIEAGYDNGVADGQEVAKVGDLYVWAGSRSRWLQPGKGDNFGFGGWVHDNAEEIVALLGPGRHYGEWWGAGIQRKYGLTAKRFSLFNVSRYGEQTAFLDPRCSLRDTSTFGEVPNSGLVVEHKKVCACREARAAIKAEIGGVLIEPVPVLYRGPWFLSNLGRWCHGYALDGVDYAPSMALEWLRREGSQAVPFMDPEGICIWHEASGELFKWTLESDEKPKEMR